MIRKRDSASLAFEKKINMSKQKTPRCVTRNVLGHGSFLGIRATKTTIYNTRKKRPTGEKSPDLLPGNF